MVKFIHGYMKDAPREVFCALLTELSPNAYHLLRSTPSQQRLFESLQAVVKECRMTFFRFAQYLLRSQITRHFIFSITKCTGEFYAVGNCTH